MVSFRTFGVIASLAYLALPAAALPSSEIESRSRAEISEGWNLWAWLWSWPTGDKCLKVHVHQEWRDMTKHQKSKYIKAVKCLMSRPAKGSRPNVYTRFEDFMATHIDLTERVHYVGHFLPWHRQFGRLYWEALRNECGYTGPFAFWDSARDIADGLQFKDSPVFDPITGFGGDGVPGTYELPPDPEGLSFVYPDYYRGCVQDGPFKDLVVHRGPGKLNTTHCLVRGIQDNTLRPDLVESASAAHVAKTIATADTYEDFRLLIDDLMFGAVHGTGHVIVAGEMLNSYSAGADPLFYLHHANLDRMWWKWQNKAPANRRDMSGPSTQNGTDTIDLDFVMDFPVVGRDAKISSVMDTKTRSGGCYTYAY